MDASLGSSTFGKVVTGNVGIKITPDVVDLMSKEARNEEIISWLICREGKNGLILTPDQNQYAHDVARFYTTSPTPEQAIEWHKNNPYPSGATITLKGNTINKNGRALSGVRVYLSYADTDIGFCKTDDEGNYAIAIPVSYYHTEMKIEINIRHGSQQALYSQEETYRVLAPYIIPPIKMEIP